MALRLIAVAVAFTGSVFCSHSSKGVPKPPKLVREDSRQYIEPEVMPRGPFYQRHYKPSSRSVKFARPAHVVIPAQNLDIPAHLRSCSCCPEPVQIEGLPDIPWYLRMFACCFCRPR